MPPSTRSATVTAARRSRARSCSAATRASLCRCCRTEDPGVDVWVDVPAADDADAAVVPAERGRQRERAGALGDDVGARGEEADRLLHVGERHGDSLVDELLGPFPHPREERRAAGTV